jgi:hypothetical protein
MSKMIDEQELPPPPRLLQRFSLTDDFQVDLCCMRLFPYLSDLLVVVLDTALIALCKCNLSNTDIFSTELRGKSALTLTIHRGVSGTVM